MPRTLPRRLIAGRAAQTGERYCQALAELSRLPHGLPPVPDAATPDQAFLEAQLLERLGRWDPDRWRQQMQPFGLRSVSPRPHEVVIRVPEEFLPDVMRAVLPGWAAEHDGRDYPEISGIPGLRPRYEQGRGILYRPGFSGRIAVPVTPGLWRKALLVVSALNNADHVRMPWLSVSCDWHPGEIGFADAWPDTFSPAGEWYRNSRFTSRILRRLPGLCPAPRAEWHDLWINHFTSNPAINLEWENGLAHAAALQRLLDPDFGPGAELELLDGQSAEDCYRDTAGRVKVRSTEQPGTYILLRRLLAPPGGPALDFGAWRRAEREAAERAHNYPSARGLVPVSGGVAASGRLC